MSTVPAKEQLVKRYLTLRIDKNGRSACYSVRRMRPEFVEEVRRYELVKHGTRDRYTCVLDEAGGLSCTCPDFVHRHHQCKHLDALVAAGMLDPHDWMEVSTIQRAAQIALDEAQGRCNLDPNWPVLGAPASYHGARVVVTRVCPKLCTIRHPDGGAQRVRREEVLPVLSVA